MKKLLGKHDYTIRVNQSPDGCVARFPAAPLMNPLFPAPSVLTYRLTWGPESGVTYSNDRVDDDAAHFRAVPEYALRMFVLGDLSAFARQIPISESLIEYVNDQGVVVETIADVIAPPADGDAYKKEGFLIQLMTAAREDNFPPEYEDVAARHGVGEGYRLVSSFFMES